MDSQIIVSANYTKANALKELKSAIIPYLDLRYNPERYVPVVFNIGTDRCSGDSLGPLVGWLLKRNDYKGIYIGDLENPVHAKNLEESKKLAWKLAMAQGKMPFIIAVDSCIGMATNIGLIHINKGGMKPGAGLGKELGKVGSINIQGVVAAQPLVPNPMLTNMLLSSTRLHLVVEMSVIISDLLNILYEEYFEPKMTLYIKK